MNKNPSRRSPAVITLFTVFMVLVLYVATWPPIEIPYTFTVVNSGRYGPHIFQHPHWLHKVYWPLHKLRDTTGPLHRLTTYWEWWKSIILFPQIKPPPPSTVPYTL